MEKHDPFPTGQAQKRHGEASYRHTPRFGNIRELPLLVHPDKGMRYGAGAFKQFHHWCELLFNDNSFTYGVIKVLDENLDTVEGKMELINRRQPEPEPEPTPEPEE